MHSRADLDGQLGPARTLIRCPHRAHLVPRPRQKVLLLPLYRQGGCASLNPRTGIFVQSVEPGRRRRNDLRLRSMPVPIKWRRHQRLGRIGLEQLGRFIQQFGQVLKPGVMRRPSLRRGHDLGIPFQRSLNRQRCIRGRGQSQARVSDIHLAESNRRGERLGMDLSHQ